MLKHSYFKRKPTVPLKRTKLRKKSVSPSATIADHIQETARFIVTYRDGGCILRDLRHPGEGEAQVIEGKIVSDRVIQAEHLVTRSNAVSYADTRLIVCICKNCHGWKHFNHQKEYDALIKSLISPKRVKLWDKVEEWRKAHKSRKVDMKMQLVGLQMELKQYEQQ